MPNRFQRENEIRDLVFRLFQDGSIRSTGDEIIHIDADFNSVALSLNIERLQQVILEVVENTIEETGGDQDNRMR